MSLVKNPFINENTWVPNYNIPKEVVFADSLLGWVVLHTAALVPHSIYSLDIKKKFGDHAKGQYYKDLLLICVNHSYDRDKGICKQYILNQRGVDFLIQKITQAKTKISAKESAKYSINAAVKEAEELYKDLLIDLANGTLKYKDIGSRLYNNLQNVRKDVRKILISKLGFIHDYDIEAAAPTLLLQIAKMIGLTEELITINFYLINKTKCRKELAALLDVPLFIAKQIITALFNGALITGSIAELLEDDETKIQLLKEYEFIQNLKSDVSIMWKVISTVITGGESNKLDCIGKAEVYRILERMILNSVIEYLDRTDNKRLLIHDGWVTQSRVDLRSLNKHIFNSTGFNVNLDYECFTL